MKNKILLVLLLGGTLFACNDDDFLAEKPQDFLTDENGYDTPNQINLAMGELYSQMRTLYNSQDSYNDWALMGLGNDLFMIPRGNGSDQVFNDWGRLDANSLIAEKWWKVCYAIIKNSNEILSQISNSQIPWKNETQKNEKLAEARFFRGYAYRCLANVFGGVPLLENAIKQPRLDFTRSSREETYKFAVADLEFAAKNLPQTLSKDGVVVKATADHLLSELYIALSDNGETKFYEKAIEAATRVIDGTDGDYHLMNTRFGRRANEDNKDVYWDLFRIGNQNYLEANNKECLWAVQFEYNTPGGTSALGRMNVERVFWPSFWGVKKFGYDGVARDWTGRGVAFMRPTNFVLYNMWNHSEGDIRNSEANVARKFYAPKPLENGVEVDKDVLYRTPVTLASGEEIMVELKPGDEIKKEWLTTRTDTMENYFPRFFKFGTDKHLDARPEEGYVTDYYVFRLAETYLLRAEAYLKLGNKAKAASDINIVRERAQAPLITASDVDIDYLLDERARELLGEEYRFMTLSRMNLVYERTKKYGWDNSQKTIKEYNNLFPIPQVVIDANLEANFEQNPGY